MLLSLYIENIAVIKRLEIEFRHGFTVLTGETGAGKSIIIDSIGLLTGNRADKELIRTGEDFALVSAVFGNISREILASLEEMGIYPDEDGQIMIQRRISADGRSQAKINGRSVPLSVLSDVGKLLINIHGQHDNQALLNPSKHIDFLDKYANTYAELSEYLEQYRKFLNIRNEISTISRNEREKARMQELLEYQIKDISSAKLKVGEEETLLTNKKKIQNIEKISKQARIVYRALYQNDKGGSACQMIDYAINAISQMDDVLPNAAQYIEKLTEFRYEIEAIAESAYSVANDDIGDPTAALNAIEARLDQIQKLKRKYGSTIEEILEYEKKARKELEAIVLSDERMEELKAELKDTKENMRECALRLSEKRGIAAINLQRKVAEELKFLDMEKVTFKVMCLKNTDESGEYKYSQDGVDNVEFLISTNLGEPPKPLSKIASGGELSRIMLALKCVLSDKEGTPSLIFDEIDTGISGKTSEKIGIKLKELSNTAQVFCITHAAQIAAIADNHYKISKGEVNSRTETKVQEIKGNDRVMEVARIMGGINITETIIKSAEEMIYNKK